MERRNVFGQDGPTGALCEGKLKHLDNPFIDSVQKQTMVDMKDVMVLNDIIEQAAGQQTGPTDHGGKIHVFIYPPTNPKRGPTPSQYAYSSNIA